MAPTDTAPATPFADLAVPRDFSARSGDGLEGGLCLGGGGVFFVAWQVSYLHTAAAGGVDLATAGRVVGTSAGSVVATNLVGGRLGFLHAQLSLLSRAPGVIAALMPSADLGPSQLRALELFRDATDDDPDTIREIGRAALAAVTQSPAAVRRNLSLVVGRGRWPSKALHITATDTFTGERCVVTHRSGITRAAAVGASSAVPGIFPPQPIGDRRCMDGGVGGSGTHLDLLAGARRVVAFTLNDHTEPHAGMMTQSPDAFPLERQALIDSGTELLQVSPAEVDLLRLMSPTAIPDAVAMGRRQALEDLERLAAFWHGR
jgi:NTE family protein